MEFNESQAIYLQIGDYLLEEILLNKLKEGDRIPSVRELAVKMEVNPNTAMRTFSFLTDKNIIYNKRGIGYFVSDGAFDKALELKKEAFINEYLPEFFKTLALLGISIDEVKTMYEKQQKES